VKRDLPGFHYDAVRKLVHLSCYAKGGKGKVRRERTVPVHSIQEARAEWTKFRAEISMSEQSPETPFSIFITRELPRVCADVKASTATWYEDAITSRLLPFFGAMRLSQITKAKVGDFVTACRTDMKKPVSPARINGLLRVLRLLLHHAVDRGYLAIYPLHKLEFLKVELPELELKRAEQAAFLRAFGDEEGFMTDLARRRPAGRVVQIARPDIKRMGTKRKFGAGMRPGSRAAKSYFARFAASKALFVVAIETGLRREDLRLLHWEQVDLAARWIRVTAKKTGKPVAVPITDACREALLSLRARPLVSVLVFITVKGLPFSKSTVDAHFALAKRLAGITRRCRFHDLRHTFGSNASSKGIPLQFIQKAMGHSTFAMVQRYARPDDEAVQQAFLGK